MCLFHKIKHFFTLFLSTLYLSLVPERSVIFYQHSVKECIKFLCYNPESSVNFKKQQSVSLWNFLVNTHLLYIPLLTLIDGQTDRQRDEYTRCVWAGGTFFSVVLLCQFLALAGNRFGFYILMHLEYNTVVVLCQFFGSGRKQFLVLRTYLVYNAVVRLCQFFGCGGKQISK